MATEGGPSIVTEGLVLALDAANVKSYPGTGTTWSDLSGNGYNATLINGATIDNGSAELEYAAAVADGSNDLIRIENTAVSALGSPLTYTCWFRIKSEGYTNQILSLMGTSGTSPTGTGLALHIGASSRQLRLWVIAYDSNGNQKQLGRTSGPQLELDRWYMASFTHEGSESKIFLNNELDFQSSNVDGLLTSTTDRFTIGLNRIYWHFGGYISDVKVYSKALTPSEILQNYNATKSRFNL